MIIGFVNRYRGRDGVIWSGRTIFPSAEAARSCPCASRYAYVDTCALGEIDDTVYNRIVNRYWDNLTPLLDRIVRDEDNEQARLGVVPRPNQDSGPSQTARSTG